MKNIILLRHAKSISFLNEISDFKRTLNEKGRGDVPKIANAFKDLDVLPDIILCSSAYRTKETIELFNATLRLKAEIIYIPELYHASAAVIFEIISGYTQYNNIMVVGHNLGISILAEELSKTGAREMNTCGLYILQFKNKVEQDKGEILHYLSPKNI